MFAPAPFPSGASGALISESSFGSSVLRRRASATARASRIPLLITIPRPSSTRIDPVATIATIRML